MEAVFLEGHGVIKLGGWKRVSPSCRWDRLLQRKEGSSREYTLGRESGGVCLRRSDVLSGYSRGREYRTEEERCDQVKHRDTIEQPTLRGGSVTSA